MLLGPAYRGGAPRSMKMGTIRSPFPYDEGACCALRSPMPTTCCSTQNSTRPTEAHAPNPGVPVGSADVRFSGPGGGDWPPPAIREVAPFDAFACRAEPKA